MVVRVLSIDGKDGWEGRVKLGLVGVDISEGAIIRFWHGGCQLTCVASWAKHESAAGGYGSLVDAPRSVVGGLCPEWYVIAEVALWAFAAVRPLDDCCVPPS